MSARMCSTDHRQTNGDTGGGRERAGRARRRRRPLGGPPPETPPLAAWASQQRIHAMCRGPRPNARPPRHSPSTKRLLRAAGGAWVRLSRCRAAVAPRKPLFALPNTCGLTCSACMSAGCRPTGLCFEQFSESAADTTMRVTSARAGRGWTCRTAQPITATADRTTQDLLPSTCKLIFAIPHLALTLDRRLPHPPLPGWDGQHSHASWPLRCPARSHRSPVRQPAVFRRGPRCRSAGGPSCQPRLAKPACCRQCRRHVQYLRPPPAPHPPPPPPPPAGAGADHRRR